MRRLSKRAQKRKKDALLKDATVQVESFQGHILRFNDSSSKKPYVRPRRKHGEFQLPDVILHQIMGKLAIFEPDGVYGPCLAANSLASAALVSWDFYSASKIGFQRLEQQAQSLNEACAKRRWYWARPSAAARNKGIHPPQTQALAEPFPIRGGYSMEQWSKIIADPLSVRKVELVKAAHELNVPSSGNKVLLVVRVLGAFGLQAPSQAPLGLLRTMAREKYCQEPFPDLDVLRELRVDLKILGQQAVEELNPSLLPVMDEDAGCALIRKRLFQAGVCDKAQLLQLHAKVIKL